MLIYLSVLVLFAFENDNDNDNVNVNVKMKLKKNDQPFTDVTLHQMKFEKICFRYMHNYIHM